MKATLTMQGPGVRENATIGVLGRGLLDLQKVMDGTYLTLIGRKRKTNEDNAAFRVHATKLEEGSIVVELQVLLYDYLPAIAIVGVQLSPQVVWAHLKAMFQLLKHGRTRTGERPSIDVTESNNVDIVSGGITYNVNTLIVNNIGEANRHALTDIAEMMNTDEITSFVLSRPVNGVGSDEALNIDQEIAGALLSGEKVEGSPIEVLGTVVGFDADTRRGKLRVRLHQRVPVGKYGFSFTAGVTQDSIVDALRHGKHVRVTATPIFEVRLLTQPKVHELRLSHLEPSVDDGDTFSA